MTPTSTNNQSKPDFISMAEYCPRSRYGMTIRHIVDKVVDDEDNLNHDMSDAEVLKAKKDAIARINAGEKYRFKQKKVKIRHAVYTIFRSVLP